MISTRSYGSLRPERLFALAELNWCINNTRRGRCPHRPGRTNCFFDSFWRIRDFPMGRCGHRPLRTLTKNFKSAVGASLIGGHLNKRTKSAQALPARFRCLLEDDRSLRKVICARFGLQHGLALCFRDEAAAGCPDNVRRVFERRVKRLGVDAILAGACELDIAVEARAGRRLDENALGVPALLLLPVGRAVIDRGLTADQMLRRPGNEAGRPSDRQSVRRRFAAEANVRARNLLHFPRAKS